MALKQQNAHFVLMDEPFNNNCKLIKNKYCTINLNSLNLLF
ncbi:hypothetical protein Cabys_1660 [Caldithrix abyssi DSM 13497]|uniref:Uncharacterized protein n=1 Tax=Caldithrix abyssi DSM 13497 TaxID=880073 RepID=A0A1J1C7Z9_CALAY|nr:hypothetical protein Cabys_1660 [Caldithrix abyssi DSM 13497]